LGEKLRERERRELEREREKRKWHGGRGSVAFSKKSAVTTIKEKYLGSSFLDFHACNGQYK